MKKSLSLLTCGAAIVVGGLALAAPASADASTTTKCSDWKLNADRYIQSCVDITGDQVHTYGFISSASSRDSAVGITGRIDPFGASLGRAESSVQLNADTVLVDGSTTTVAAGTKVHSTIYLPNTPGTGTLVGPDGATYVDPDVPPGPAGPTGPGGVPKPTVTEQVTVWAYTAG
jgi:hypothetical protein